MLRSLIIRRIVKSSQYNFSSVSPSLLNMKLCNEKKTDDKSELAIADQSKLVAAAFASLKDISNDTNSKRGVREKITSATNLNSLLSIVEKPFLSRYNALMVLTSLTNWVNEGKIKLSDFELDPRFVRLCRILGQSQSGSKNEDMADLSVVLGVTADEQAAKLISSISLPQMVKILKSLSIKKRRSTPLLRSLAFNIANTSQPLNIKEASDVFYSLAELNYPDEILLEKVREDFRECLAKNEKPSVVCSVIRSLGLLRYRDTELLDQLIEWIMKYSLSLSTKELLPLLFTLASVNYKPENFARFYKILEPHLNENEMVDTDKFIDVAWSLVILQYYNERIIKSVMDPEFISKLASKNGSVENVDVPEKIRLIQINSVAKQLGDSYKGFLLDENSALYQITLTQRKEKLVMIDSVKDTLSNVVSKLDEYVEVNVNSNMGFFIDLVCYVDKKSTLVKINSNHQNEGVKKVALMMCDYHDFCRGCRSELIGSTALKLRLLSGIGYFVIPIFYTEYSHKDMVINRVRFVHEKIKEITSEA